MTTDDTRRDRPHVSRPMSRIGRLFGAALLTGDPGDLRALLAEAERIGLPDRELAELVAMAQGAGQKTESA